MINSTYNPLQSGDFDKRMVSTDAKSAIGTCPAGQTQNIDLLLNDDHLLTGIQLLAKGSVFGDSFCLQVVAPQGTLPNGAVFPQETVLAQFATDINVRDDVQEKFNETAIYPAKLLAGLILRCKYTSLGQAPVDVAANYRLHKVLV